MADAGRRNPDWAWDEIVLACDLVMQNGGRALPAENSQVIELSELLQKMTIHPLTPRRTDFRNPNGVGRKTADIATHLPGYAGRPTNGGRRDEDVIAKFIAEPGVMHATAETIRTAVAGGEPADFPAEVGYDGESEMEGRYLLRWHAYRERNPALRKRKISSVLAGGGLLACESCHFDFGEVYGERGRGYIECHHVEPLHVGGEGPRGIRDLALLCSNCHRMIHTKPPWPTPAELRDIIRGQAEGLSARYSQATAGARPGHLTCGASPDSTSAIWLPSLPGGPPEPTLNALALNWFGTAWTCHRSIGEGLWEQSYQGVDYLGRIVPTTEDGGSG